MPRTETCKQMAVRLRALSEQDASDVLGYADVSNPLTSQDLMAL